MKNSVMGETKNTKIEKLSEKRALNYYLIFFYS